MTLDLNLCYECAFRESFQGKAVQIAEGRGGSNMPQNMSGNFSPQAWGWRVFIRDVQVSVFSLIASSVQWPDSITLSTLPWMAWQGAGALWPREEWFPHVNMTAVWLFWYPITKKRPFPTSSVWLFWYPITKCQPCPWPWHPANHWAAPID